MPLLDAGTLERVTRDIFARLGAPADDAAWIATLLVRANLRGHDSHGVAQVADLLGYARSAPLAAGAKEILVPGEPEARTEQERRARGVPLDDETWRQIRACAAEAGVDA
ncbi:MAG: Ldh family oxidoreductase [Candidatus Rokubacteria bacterium]|nr:Ldh family oxidoreductase [Candidatus Rokubacteria bacterium]